MKGLLPIVLAILCCLGMGCKDVYGKPIDFAGLFKSLFAVGFITGAPIIIALIIIFSIKGTAGAAKGAQKMAKNAEEDKNYPVDSIRTRKRILDSLEGKEPEDNDEDD